MYRAQVLRARQLPQSGHLVAGLPPDLDFEVRRFLLERFPYAVFAARLPREIVIVAVAHQHRRPRYWARRLAKVRT
jgi:plasmid stabilization system protein ParE